MGTDNIVPPDWDAVVIDISERLAEALKKAGSHWTSVSAVGTFILYMFGYLSLRFRLTALGVSTDLSFVDERYLFEGVRFFVYVFSTLPNLVLVALLVTGPFFILYRLMPRSWREPLGRRLFELVGRIRDWWRQPPRLTVLSIISSLLIIQLLMRKVYGWSNLLVADDSTQMTSFECILLSDQVRDLYFQGLVSAALVIGLMLFAGGWPPTHNLRGLVIGSVGMILFTLQILLLPINYGALISAGRAMPGVRSLDGETPLAAGASAWLIWEGRDTVTYFLESGTDGPGQRTLVSIPRSKVMETEIFRYDNVIARLMCSSSTREAGPPIRAGEK